MSYRYWVADPICIFCITLNKSNRETRIKPDFRPEQRQNSYPLPDSSTKRNSEIRVPVFPIQSNKINISPLSLSTNWFEKMAGRSSSSTMIVTNTPAKDLAYTNLAYCSPSDLRQFAVPGSDLFLALVGDVFVLSIGYPFTSLRYYHFVVLFDFSWISCSNYIVIC